MAAGHAHSLHPYIAAGHDPSVHCGWRRRPPPPFGGFRLATPTANSGLGATGDATRATGATGEAPACPGPHRGELDQCVVKENIAFDRYTPREECCESRARDLHPPSVDPIMAMGLLRYVGVRESSPETSKPLSGQD